MLVNITGDGTVLEFLHEYRLEVEQESVNRFLLLKQNVSGERVNGMRHTFVGSTMMLRPRLEQ